METQKNATVRLSEQVKKEEAMKLHAYVVNSEGKIIETAPFRNNEAQLRTSRENLDGKSKVYIASALPENLKASKRNERTLIKIGAYNLVKNFNGNFIDVSQIPSEILRPFRYYDCLIKGNVNKNFIIDGQAQNLPLCDLRVHICEVETELVWPYIPIYYRRIPDWVIQEIADKIRQFTAIEKPIIRKPIGPDPAPDTLQFAQQAKFNLPLRDLKSNKTFSGSKKVAQIAPLPKHVTEAFNTTSVDSIREAMISYHDVIYPYLCLWPIYWPWIYTCDEDTVVTTDCNGNFEMWENTFSEDGPLNIYIWIEAFINGSWQTIYKPPIPCNTWWNYPCNTNINVTLNQYNTLRGAYGENLYNLLAPCHCGIDGPADAFWFRSIGEYAGALHIQQNDASISVVQGVNIRNVGCTNVGSDITAANTNWINPFGGGLGLQVFAGEHIFNAGVTHYRWKAIRIKDANLNPVFSFAPPAIVNSSDPSAIAREYIVGTGGGHYQSYTLPLADGSGNDLAFFIPHQVITNETRIPAARLGADTFWRDVFWNSASFDSNGLGDDGLYRFDLELGHRDGAGHFVRDEVNPLTFKISQYADLDSNEDTTMDYLNINSGTGNAINFTMLVRIDNSVCHADIHDAQLTDSLGNVIMRIDPNDGIFKPVQSGSCGFIKYDNTGQAILLSFEATHPHNFASFGYTLTKGNGTDNPNIGVTSGFVFSAIGTNLQLSSGVFSEDVGIATLLGNCPGQAAFAENLGVYALATNGSSRLTYLDRSDVNAFAISNV